ncbi:zonular occludens toxin domain-containing protein [Cupriavidus basilensis]|uniref:Zonular occludens toxin domain-containing protein n=1 Tax=Cupriavidus basilensis TaxID=68895 RepID=A0ABT6AGU9_9BURK|nr:zonular occludens toxin domain-containing protein [Cupriavidus basilensis]MDF3831818.1 zonular occludens toxin domain-containing protein [Cupriavidus basilensis]
MSTSVVTLVTGLQGNGKTLFGIHSVKKLWEEEGAKEGAVFYHGINELVLPWLPLEKPEDWPDVPDGSVVFIDEAQKLFRVRANGAAVPRWVSELETLRHRGIRLWLFTQHPMLLDNNVRRLCGRHIHLVRKFGAQASSLHEWNAVRENCDKPAGRKDSQRSTFKFPKSVYGLYKSAEVHTVKRKIPPKVMAIVPLSIAALVLLGYVGYRKVYKPMHGEAELTQAAGSQKGGQIAYGTEGDRRARPLTTAEYVQSYTPRIPGLDYTAPAYDDLTKPKRVPVPAACVTFKGGCNCYTQQGTRLPVQKDQCAQIVQTGFFMAFDPDGERPQQVAQPVPVVAPAPPPEAAKPAPMPQFVVLDNRRSPSAMDLEALDQPEKPRFGYRR